MRFFYIRYKPYIMLLALAAILTLALGIAPLSHNFFVDFINKTSFIFWHNVFEFSGIIIAICIFCVAYYSFEQKQNFKYLILGSMMLLMAYVDFFHVMSYKGMPDFLISNDLPNRATTFWIIARLIGALGLLAAIILPAKLRIRFKKVLFFILPSLVSVIILIVATYYPHLIPPMHLGEELTKLKIVLEIFVVFLYLFGIAFILKTYKSWSDSLLVKLSSALMIGIFSGLSFTLYTDVYGVYNFLGHLLKFIMFFIVFRVVFIRNIQQPYADLSIAHAEIKNYAENLDRIVEKRTDEIKKIHQLLLNDLEYARDIQLSMLPKTMPNTPDTIFEARYFPAERVSGDFYNIFKLNENQIGMYIGDVSGHGVPAAMLTVFLNQSIKPVIENSEGIQEILPPSEVLENVFSDYNETNFSSEVYLVMLYGIYDHSTREFTYSSAGLNVQPLVVSHSGEIKELDIKGLPISRLPVASRAGYTNSTIKLEKGDKLLFYSDGLTEAINTDKKIYSDSRLKKQLYHNRNSNALQLTDSIVQHVFHFIEGHPLRDDITFFVMEVK